jgi:hypothetical protein
LSGRGFVVGYNSRRVIPKPSWFDWLTVAAIILGPVLALLSQRVLDRIRLRKDQRLRLYFALMASRALQLSPNHVQALNSIDTVFSRSSKKDRTIREKYRAWLEQMGKDSTAEGWVERGNDLKVELYQAIGEAVGFNFSIDYLKRQAYLPIATSDWDAQARQIQQGLAKAITPDGLKVEIVEKKPMASGPTFPPPPSLR